MMADILYELSLQIRNIARYPSTNRWITCPLENQHWGYSMATTVSILSEAALYWAITYYHEDPRAPEVADPAIQPMWLQQMVGGWRLLRGITDVFRLFDPINRAR